MRTFGFQSNLIVVTPVLVAAIAVLALRPPDLRAQDIYKAYLDGVNNYRTA